MWEGILSIIAIVLSAASFYHEFFSRGRVILPRPLGLALMEGPSTGGSNYQHLWRFRMLFCNIGARHRLVHNLRLTVSHGELRAVMGIGQWKATVAPRHDESGLADSGGDFASAFALPPRSIFERIGVFVGSGDERWLRLPGRYECTIEALLDRGDGKSPTWRVLTRFRISLREEQCTAVQACHWIFPQTEDVGGG